jgi:hypothetical protein
MVLHTRNAENEGQCNFNIKICASAIKVGFNFRMLANNSHIYESIVLIETHKRSLLHVYYWRGLWVAILTPSPFHMLRCATWYCIFNVISLFYHGSLCMFVHACVSVYCSSWPIFMKMCMDIFHWNAWNLHVYTPHSQTTAYRNGGQLWQRK